MKFLNIALLAIVTFTAGCSKAPDYGPAISTVMQARQQAIAASTITTMEKNAGSVPRVNLARYAPALRAVDVSACPPDFRKAWIDYIHAVEDQHKRNPALGLVAGVLAAQTGSQKAADMAVAQVDDGLRRAREALEDVATAYNARF